jgi:hypothetical protein
VWLVIALALAPGLLGGLIGLVTSLFGVGVFVLPVAFVLFVAGLVVAVYIFNRARAAGDI